MAQLYPLLTVGALVFNKLGEVLFLRTHKWKHRYGLPGGKIEPGETAEEALRREMLEETGLTVENIEFILFQEVIFSEEFYKPMHFIFFNYTCEAVGDSTVLLNEEAQSFRWMLPAEALLCDDLNSPTRLLLEEVLRRKASSFASQNE